MDAGEIDALLDALAGADVGVGHGGEPLLVLPQQRADILHGDGDHGPGAAETEGQGSGAPEDHAPVAGDDAAGHARHEGVHQTGHQLLAACAGRCQGGHGGGEGLLEVEGL